jgi:hypothetical protein
MRDPAPPNWRFKAPAVTKKQFGDQVVYFTAPYASQLRANGSAYGERIGDANAGLERVGEDMNGEDDLSTAVALQ